MELEVDDVGTTESNLQANIHSLLLTSPKQVTSKSSHLEDHDNGNVLDIPMIYNRIVEAHRMVRPMVRETPLDVSPILSKMTGCNKLLLKCDFLQHTGSFKYRGATNRIRLLTDRQRVDGVITASTGNHGQAIALAAKLAGTHSTIYAPKSAAPIKLQAIEALGGTVQLVDGNMLLAEKTANAHAQEKDILYISPYNDIDIVAGQGTCGMEIVDQSLQLGLESVDAVFVAVGGGGLITGTAIAIKQRWPNCKVVGCWPANACSLYQNLEAGRIFEADEQPTIADGTAGGVDDGAITFELCQQLIDERVLVSEEEIKSAMKLIANTDRFMIEGAAGVPLAAALKTANHYQNKNIVVVLCGRNIMLEKYIKSIEEVL
ncbi:hypothetical protein SAMD00019534_101920 [Acytostelium subglobosum LB1]|uniref:hypothetical protein n=1 Tax=Acytostelium subglobosum LB1 TaxID=1410327 RepID=UPI000644E8C9|nr:hypothetical protein SAMD00019534_101920 [Acytostelium subglobosum LB1]GAM27017.1 hypothetical protein SAMD00019534_101920 [Acytostelium subglobosum LB1]|eukprot:XP_012749897.1 hypothetical protein SAMD00019534_101920 [Acytostelium subglobosum LB1]